MNVFCMQESNQSAESYSCVRDKVPFSAGWHAQMLYGAFTTLPSSEAPRISIFET
jgi:hypothetical protein